MECHHTGGHSITGFQSFSRAVYWQLLVQCRLTHTGPFSTRNYLKCPQYCHSTSGSGTATAMGYTTSSMMIPFEIQGHNSIPLAVILYSSSSSSSSKWGKSWEQNHCKWWELHVSTNSSSRTTVQHFKLRTTTKSGDAWTPREFIECLSLFSNSLIIHICVVAWVFSIQVEVQLVKNQSVFWIFMV